MMRVTISLLLLSGHSPGEQIIIKKTLTCNYAIRDEFDIIESRIFEKKMADKKKEEKEKKFIEVSFQ